MQIDEWYSRTPRALFKGAKLKALDRRRLGPPQREGPKKETTNLGPTPFKSYHKKDSIMIEDEGLLQKPCSLATNFCYDEMVNKCLSASQQTSDFLSL